MTRLSKSRFISGWQCHLKLWYDVHRRDLRPEPDEALQAIFDTGHQVGELAQQRWPGGVLVDGPHWAVDRAEARTQELLNDASVPAIYEAAIVHRGALTRVDVLVRHPDGSWDLVEVKSSTRVKEPYDTDLALQYWILQGAGLRLRRAGVLVLNRDYVYPGGELDLQTLFRFEDLTALCEARLDEIGAQVDELQQVMQRFEPPAVAVGPHCHTPYDCPYYEHCSRDLPENAYPLTLLPRFRGSEIEQLAGEGIETLHELPADYPLNDLQARVRECIVNGRPWASPQLGKVLADVQWPLYFLDFEAALSAIPRFAGTRPFEAVPFQFSCHIQAHDGAAPEHTEYLHTQPSDPRRDLAQALLAVLGEQGSIVVYTGYEARMIDSLAEALPDMAQRLRALKPRLYDLHRVIVDHYCHPDFRGSYSIKAVLPALVPGMSYADMAIADGMAAARAWLQMIDSPDPAFRQQIDAELRAYCQQDSLAMLKLREELTRA